MTRIRRTVHTQCALRSEHSRADECKQEPGKIHLAHCEYRRRGGSTFMRP
jgi:hypothetical protein